MKNKKFYANYFDIWGQRGKGLLTSKNYVNLYLSNYTVRDSVRDGAPIIANSTKNKRPAQTLVVNKDVPANTRVCFDATYRTYPDETYYGISSSMPQYFDTHKIGGTACAKVK